MGVDPHTRERDSHLLEMVSPQSQRYVSRRSPTRRKERAFWSCSIRSGQLEPTRTHEKGTVTFSGSRSKLA